MRLLNNFCRGVLSSLLVAVVANVTQAQSLQDAAQVPSGSIPAATSDTNSSARVAGPKIYITDANKRLWTYDTGSNAVSYIGAGSKVLTDISFAPGGKMYGITFSEFFRVNPSNGQQTRIGSLGVNDVNALSCYSASSCYAASTKPEHGNTPGKLYRVDTATGRATLIGSFSPYYSGGDLTREDGSLYLSSNNASKRLLKLNPSTGAVLSSKVVGLEDLFGLAAIGSNKMFGFSKTKAYRLNENTGSKTLIKDLATVVVPGTRNRVGRIYGAAFNGYF